ncbi:hypothetical protein L9F63_009159, partial [Diploptera punctata]
FLCYFLSVTIIKKTQLFNHENHVSSCLCHILAFSSSTLHMCTIQLELSKRYNLLVLDRNLSLHRFLGRPGILMLCFAALLRNHRATCGAEEVGHTYTSRTLRK